MASRSKQSVCLLALAISLSGCGNSPESPAPAPAPPAVKHTVLTAPNLDTEVGFAMLHTNGEFSGNLDFTIRITPTATGEQMKKNLRLHLENSESYLEVAGWKAAGNGFDVTFSTGLNKAGEPVKKHPLPETAEIIWREGGETRPLAGIMIKPTGTPEATKETSPQ